MSCIVKGDDAYQRLCYTNFGIWMIIMEKVLFDTGMETISEVPQSPLKVPFDGGVSYTRN